MNLAILITTNHMGNEILDLSKEGNLGIGNDEAFASLGYDANLALSFCHGFNLQLEGSVLAKAGISAHITDYVKAILEIEAGVEAGLQMAAQFSPKILDELGLIVSFQVYLKAYIRARLELSLTLDKILKNVKRKSNDLQYKIFKEFVDQVEVAAGVEGNAQIALTASAEVICRARLFEEEGKKAGFDFRANAEAAFLYGAGVDFFAKARFKDVNGFFRSSKNHLLQEIKDNITPDELDEDVTNFIFNAWSLALDLIIDASIAGISEKRDLTFASVKDFSIDFIFEEILEAYTRFLDHMINKIVDWVEKNVDAFIDQIEEVLFTIENTINKITSIASLHDVALIVEDIIAILEEIKFDEVDVIKEVGTHLFVIGYLIDPDHKDLWKKLPLYAKKRYHLATGKNIQLLKNNGEAYLYLEKSCFTQFLTNNIGTTGSKIEVFLDKVHQNGLTIGNFIELILDKDDAQSQKKILNILFTFLETTFDTYVVTPVQSSIQPIFSRSRLGEDYYNLVFENTLSSFPKLFIPMLKSVFVEGGDKTKIEQLTFLANRFLLGFAAKNISFMSNELMNYATDNITHTINTCENSVKNGKFDFMAKRFFKAFEDKISDITPLPVDVKIPARLKEDLIDVTEEFILNILDVAKMSMGRQTWTEDRIDIITSAIENMIADPDDHKLDFTSLTTQEVEQKINELMECDFLPDVSKRYLEDLSEVLMIIGWEQFKAFLLYMPVHTAWYIIQILKVLLVNVIREILDAIKKLVDTAYELVKKIIEELEELINELINEIEQAIEDLKEIISNLYNETKKAIEAFFDSLLGDLDFSDLDWLDRFIDWVVFWDGNDEDKARNVIKELKKQTLSKLNKTSFENDILNLSKEDGFDFQTIPNWIEDNVLTSDIKQKLGRAKFKTSNAVQVKWMDANDKVFTISNNLRETSWRYTARTNQLENSRSRKSALQLKKTIYDKRYEELEKLKDSRIKINSPLSVDANRDDFPIYDKYVYLEIDFDKLDVKSIIKNQYEIKSEDLVNVDREISTNEVISTMKNTIDRDTASLLQLKILLNGQELDLEEFLIDRHKLSIHISKTHLKQGSNDITVFVMTPSSHKEHEYIEHIQFFCDLSSKKYPSNAVYIDRKKTIINSKGDDHEDALHVDTADKEIVAITNNTEDEVRLEGWRLSDAAGHEYIFKTNDRIKPGGTHHVYVGRTRSNSDSWKGYYGNRMIALLNNRGEFLKLEDTTGKVISSMYTGFPKSNAHIKFLKN
ncbi:lamin tail domain-containing protein [Aquimarina sp. AU474]|uniref:lamin tail domain-containing protein n=1 Tax=Aquimarina sp. AU474 TaxID=2108529 RepID=UPI000D68C9E8|nr:lamin tail domain-containing protein [Aquimarina sp. AU474]